VIKIVAFYVRMLLSRQAALLVGFVGMCFVASKKGCLAGTTACWPVWLPGPVGLAIYSVVVVEPRYVAVFFTLLWIGLFEASVSPQNTRCEIWPGSSRSRWSLSLGLRWLFWQ
jgi:hypothetical protein